MRVAACVRARRLLVLAGRSSWAGRRSSWAGRRSVHPPCLLCDRPPPPSRAVRTEPCGNIRRINVEIPSLSLSDMRRLKATDHVRAGRGPGRGGVPVPMCVGRARAAAAATSCCKEQPAVPTSSCRLTTPTRSADRHLHAVPGDVPPPHLQAHAHRGAQVGWVQELSGAAWLGKGKDARALRACSPAAARCSPASWRPPAAHSPTSPTPPHCLPPSSPPPCQPPDYDNRVLTHDRAMRAGLDDVGLGVLYGLYDYK